MIFASSSGCGSAIAVFVLCRLIPLVSFTTSLFACQQLQWTAKRPKSGQRDTIPADLAAVLDHFEVQQDHWLETVEQYESLFGHAVGRADSLVAVAERMELQHLKGIAACRTAFT